MIAEARREFFDGGTMGLMRRFIFVVALASACATPTSPSTSLSGVWAENFPIPGASLILTLDAAGDGSGTYAIEAGRSGVVQVTGTRSTSGVTLVIVYDYGLTRTFVGALSDSSHLTGSFSDAGGSIVFTRR